MNVPLNLCLSVLVHVLICIKESILSLHCAVYVKLGTHLRTEETSCHDSVYLYMCLIINLSWLILMVHAYFMFNNTHCIVDYMLV